MESAKTRGIELRVSDVSGQKTFDVRNVPQDSTVGEFIQSLLAEMSLPRNDAVGRPLTYHARLEREGRHLNASELLGDAVLDRDSITLAPDIEAG